MAHARYLYNKEAATLANGSTVYVGVPIDPRDGSIGPQITWLDATSAATITLELTNHDENVAPVNAAGAAWEWKDSGETITGPTGAAAGSSIVNIENIRQKRARFKIVASADCVIQVIE